MATRKSEWLASIKPILDRDEAKRDAKELAKELGDLLEINIDASPENLKQLTDEFNKQLSQMGKQPIVFSEKTLHGIVNQFANAVAEGFSKGANAGLEETFKLQLANLKKQKEALLKEQDDINRRLSNRSRIEKINKFEIENAHALPIDGDAVKQAEQLLDEMYEYADRISELQAEQGKESEEYISTVLDAQEAYNEFLRMRKSLKQTKAELPKDLKAAYDLFKGDEEDRYRAAGGKTSAFNYDKYGGEIILDAFEEISDVLINTDDQLDNIQKRLKAIDLQIESIVAQAKAAGAVDDTILGDSKDGLKTLKEIEAAYDRIANKNKKTGGKALDGVSTAVDYVPGSESLTTLRNRYNTSLSSNEDWEVQYQWLVKFVKEYENYSAQIEAETDSIKRKNMRARQKQYTALYEDLKPMAENAETMLRGIIDVSGGKQPTGVKDGSKQEGDAGPTPEDVTNAERMAALERQAREEADAKAKAEAEAAEAAKQKRIEEEKAAKAAEKKRLADEAAADAQRKAAEEAERERLAKEASAAAEKAGTYTGYRAIQPPEGSHKTKHDALADWGAEYFSTDPKVSASYGQDFFKEGSIIIGEITPKNPLVINANGLRWDEFDKMPRLKELFPDLLDLMKQPGYIGDDGQKYINEQAKLAGYDAVILENVQDALDGDIKEYGLSTTIAVLDDKIVSLIGSMAQLEVGTNRFADVISSEIPSYYTRSTGGNQSQAPDIVKKYVSSSEEVKKKYQEIIALQDQIDELERKTQKTPIDIDPWNATKEQKEQVVAAWREYQKVIQEIANMPIVETEDDEKRLLELKAKAVSLYETMYQGHLNDVLGDGYAKEYGLSIEDGKQMHLDMQDTPRKDFDKSLGGLQSKLNDAYLAAQKLDEEMYKMMLHADDDSIESLYDRIRQDALAAKPAVEALNDGIEVTQNAGGTGTGDAFSAELEAAATKAETLQNELLQKDKELADQSNELARIQTDNEAKLQAEIEKRENLQKDLDITSRQLADVQGEKFEAEELARRVIEESNVKDGVIQELREQLASVKTGVSEEQQSVSSEELKNVLSSIVYNVKIAHDDADKQANKIAMDEGALESTLKRVFTNVLNPQTEQNDSEPKNAPWALEKTLLSVNEVLGQIQTNTAKIGTAEAVPSDVTGSSKVVTKLTEIKSVLSSIDTKIAKGGVINTRDEAKQSGSTPSGPNEKTQTARSNMMKSLINDYKTMGKLAAQFASDGNLETKAMLDNLKEEIRRKRDSLKLTMDENAGLREKYSIAFDAEKRLLEAEKQQKEINDQRKADAKSEKKRFADAKKMAQREAMVGKAGNAVGRAENTWMTAVGMEDVLPKEFEAQIDDYYQKLDALRKKQTELKNSDVISEENKADLITQTNNVNKLTDEIGGLIAEYQRLSGDNATVIGQNTLGSDAGLGAYEQQLKQTVMTATNGKAQIKNFDAATKTLTYTVKTGKNEFTEYTAAVRHLDGQLVSVQGTTKRTETFLEATKRKMKELTSYMSGMALFSRIGQELRRGIQYVREIDLALTELKKVTDETEESYDKFLDTAAKTADKVGSTIQKVVSSTADWARLGYSMKEAAEFAESTQILMNVSEFTDVSQATDTLISAIQAFGYTAETSMDVVDLLNTIGKQNCRNYIVICG